MKAESKVVAVSSTREGIVAVTEDGHVWVMNVRKREWAEYPSVPNTRAAEDGD